MRRRSSDFTLRQLDIFVHAARTGSFALTASQLGISQPAVSDHISTLERHLGHLLFERRRGTTPVLTREGVAMLHRAETLLSASQTMRGAGHAGAAGDKVHIRLSIGTRSRDAYLKPLLPRLYRELPHVELEILPPLPVGKVASALENGDIDLLLYAVGRPPLNLPNVHLLGNLPILLVAAPETAHLIGAGALRIEDVQFILPDFGVIAEQWLERQLLIAGIHPRRTIRYLEFTDVIQSIVEDGLGVSILMEEQVAPAIAAGRLVAFGPALEPMRRIIARAPQAPRATEELERLLIQEIGRTG
jgi:DNA-binding transcriptional LysR family regulator